MEAMLGRVLEPVLTELGHLRTRLDEIEQAQQTPATQASAPPVAAPKPVLAAEHTEAKSNGNGVSRWLFISMLSIMAVMYSGGLVFIGDQFQGIHDRLDITNARIDDTNERIDDTNERIDALGAELRAEFHTELGQLEARLIARIDALEERLRSIEIQVAEILVRLGFLEEGQAHTDDRLARVEGALNLPPLPRPPPEVSDDG